MSAAEGLNGLWRAMYCDFAGTNVVLCSQQSRLVYDYRTVVGPWLLYVGANDGV
jgi:hypothetical protein